MVILSYLYFVILKVREICNFFNPFYVQLFIYWKTLENNWHMAIWLNCRLRKTKRCVETYTKALTFQFSKKQMYPTWKVKILMFLIATHDDYFWKNFMTVFLFIRNNVDEKNALVPYMSSMARLIGPQKRRLMFSRMER